MTIEWKEIPNWPYLISNTGQVKILASNKIKKSYIMHVLGISKLFEPSTTIPIEGVRSKLMAAEIGGAH